MIGRRHRRRDAFAADLGLRLRMLLATVLTPLIVFAALALLVSLGSLRLDIGLALAILLGISTAVTTARARPKAPACTPQEEPLLHGIVDRLCVVGDLPKPAIVVEEERQPNSWVVGLRAGRSTLHVTRGLIELLTPGELEAVVGHELSHLSHRDAAVMTAVGGPSAVLLGAQDSASRTMLFGFGGYVAAAIGHLTEPGVLALSRYREFAADAGAAQLTGSPAALASALMKVSGALELIPARDLRAAAARDTFQLLPVERHARDWKHRTFGGTFLERIMLETHPPLRARIERLERIEKSLQATRRA